MFKWIPFAMVRVTLFFAGGISVYVFYPTAPSVLLFSILLFLFSSFLFLHLSKKKYRALQGIAIFSAISMAGYLLAANRFEKNKSHLFCDFEHTKAWVGRVISVPEEKANSWKLVVRMEEAKTASWKKASGKVLLHISSSAAPWKYGDRLLISGSPSAIQAPMNPGEFDYKRYLSFQNIFFQQYLKPNSFAALPRHESKGFIYYSRCVRLWASEVIKKHIDDRRAAGLCNALILGLTNDIDKDLRGFFVASGTLHVLSVSGLHVGYIYIILLGLLRPFKKSKYYNWINFAGCLIALWTFAFVSGLSPSVLRAVSMFSIFSMARATRKNVNAFNALAGSAFFLLCYNPFLLMSVGFQFSYLAVLGIVYGFDKLFRTLTFKSWLGNACWEITCVSVTAQAATLLLSLAYFHQFPNYFILSNLAIAPLVMGILMGGIALLVFSPAEGIAALIGCLVKWGCQALNGAVEFIGGLPFSFISDIHFTWTECLFLSLSVFFVILLFETRKWNWVYAAALSVILYAGARWLYFIQEIVPARLIVYSIPKDESVQFINQGKSMLWLDQKLKTKYMANSNCGSYGVKEASNKLLPMVQQAGVKLFSVGKSHAAWINAPARFPPVRYLIIGRNAVPQFEELKKVSACVVLDGSNSKKYAAQVKSFCGLHHIPFHSVTESGAFMLVK